MTFPTYPVDEDFALLEVREHLAPIYNKIYCMATGAVHRNPLYTY
jgi:hypothetical protein